ncbi:GroES-like protein [Rhizodiscina lignyota]|uniref:GroES-like protein n=1 Tax=Rhizodiscina lignyota TaxID=1504668 RepID=A0A9P4ICK7_9PEZI|nr:GroES-like protein [Rhizodiscina lignyota]
MDGHTENSTIRAVQWNGNKNLKLAHINVSDLPPLKEGQVRVAPAWCGICGSDIGEWAHGPIFSVSATTVGHEMSGIIRETHPSVTSQHPNLKPGTRVAVHPIVSDGTCHRCLAHYSGGCENFSIRGIMLDGGMQELLNVEADKCFPLPDHIPLDVAALVEPVSVAWQGVKAGFKSAGVERTDRVLVLGTGPIGIATLACLKARGVDLGNVMVVGRNKARNAKALELGVKHLYDSSVCDVAATARQLFDEYGAEIVFDAVATQSTFDDGIAALRRAGTYVMYGIFHEPVTFDANQIMMRSLKIVGTICYADEDYPEVIDAMADGRISMNELKKWITGRVPLENAEEGGLKELVKNKAKHMKILIRVNELE